MRLTKSNFKDVVPEKEQSLLDALFYDLFDINQYNINKMYIDWQDYHNEYSPERTDPCPDYYGYYTLRFKGIDGEIIGDMMTIEELDNALALLCSYNSLQNLR